MERGRYVQRLTRRAELTDPTIDVTANLQTLRVLMVDLVRSFISIEGSKYLKYIHLVRQVYLFYLNIYFCLEGRIDRQAHTQIDSRISRALEGRGDKIDNR